MPAPEAALATGGQVATDGPAPRRKRGRPAGQKMRVVAAQLRLHHFSFMRAALQGVGLRDAWERYLGFEGGPDDERHFAARLRDLIGQVQLGADQRGLSERASLALVTLRGVAKANEAAPGPDATVSALPAPALPETSPIPSLDEWVAQRCDEQGIDPDFQSHAEWLAEYRKEFGLSQEPAKLAATALPDAPAQASGVETTPSPAPLKAQLEALNQLATELALPPTLADSLGAWLSPSLARRLYETSVDGKQMPLLTLKDLIAFVGLYQYRWWKHVPRLGAERAKRLMGWLTPLAEALGTPLPETAIKPMHQLSLAREAKLAVLAPESLHRYGIVPLDRLAVPPELSGRDGVFRALGANTLKVDTDLEAIFSWLRRFDESPRTRASYGLIIERFYLWCLWVKKLPLSSLGEDDYREYRDFMARPPADWVQRGACRRDSAEWRPFKGPLSADVRKLNLSVISTFLNNMIKAGYLSANASVGVLPSMKLPHMRRINIDRSFTEAQWAWVMKSWRTEYLDCGPKVFGDEEQPLRPTEVNPDQNKSRAAALRRTRLVLELGSTTGLRLIELVTTRRSAISRELVDGQHVWIMKVHGKGAKDREVVVYDDIMELLEQHHRDMADACTDLDKKNEYVRQLRSPGAQDGLDASAEPLEDGPNALPSPEDAAGSDASDADATDAQSRGQLPLIGALRKPPPKWKLDHLGVPYLDHDDVRNTDRYGSLDPTALFQSLKRFFAKCADKAERTGEPMDVASLRRASTHWLRHFFANSAAADRVELVALKDAMGHASLNTTSIYVRAERSRLVAEISRMRRRS